MVKIRKNVPDVIALINNFVERFGNRKPTVLEIEAFITKEIDSLFLNKEDVIKFDFADVTLFSFDEKIEDERNVALQKTLTLHSVAKDVLVMMPKIIISVRKEAFIYNGEDTKPLPQIIAKIFEASVKDFAPADDTALLEFLSENRIEIEDNFDFLCDTKTNMNTYNWYDMIENPSKLISGEILRRMEIADLFLDKLCQAKANSQITTSKQKDVLA